MGANRAEAAFLLLALGTCTAISLNVSAHSTSHASQIPMPPLPQLGGAGHLDYTGAGLPPGSAALASPASVAQNVLDVLSIVPSSGQLTEGFGEELMDQQAALQQMQQDIAYQELMISKAEDYFQKLVSKVEDDRQIVEANKNIFSAWQEAVAKNAENFHGRISELNPTGVRLAPRLCPNHVTFSVDLTMRARTDAQEGYKRSGGFGSTGKQVKYKRRLLRRRKKKKSVCCALPFRATALRRARGSRGASAHSPTSFSKSFWVV